MALGFGRPLSIRAKLPIVIGAILALASGGIVAAAYAGIKAAVLAVASDRLEQADREIVDLLLPAVHQRLTAMETLAASPDVVAFVSHPAGGPDLALAARFTAYAGAVAGASIEVWTPDGARQYAAGEARAPMADADVEAIRNASEATVVVDPFRADGSSRTYQIHVAIKAGDRVAGYLVERRRVVPNNGQTTGALTGLIGSGAQMLIGNVTGDGWSDGHGAPAPSPPVPLSTRTLQMYRRPGAEPVVARSIVFPGTPWVITLEFPQATILAPAHRFLILTTGVGILVTVLGALCGWWVSGRLTRPLLQMTGAAEAIAAQQSAPRIATARADEIGRLAAAFNAMADEIDGHRRRAAMSIQELERRVRERTSALEQSNKDLESFSYSVSHDLRAPIRSISGYAKILIDDHGAELSPDARRCLDTVIRKTNEMGQLIDDLIALARVGRQALVPAPIDMTALARTVAEEVRAAEGDRALEVVVEPLPPARGERALVRQVFVNYLMNAAKFTRTRTPARVVVGAERDGAEPAYFVRDNGVGFDVKYMDKLFGVFQRLHQASDFEGTGVGLAIVRRIVERHGGRVWATSVPGEGATFYFTLGASDTTGVASGASGKSASASTTAPAVAG